MNRRFQIQSALLKACWLLAILLAVGAAHGAANGTELAEIVVPPNVERTNISDIYLSDLVSVHGVSAVDHIEIQRRLRDVRVGGSDQGRVLFSKLAIEMALKEALETPSKLAYRWDFKIPARIQVVLKSENWSKSAVEAAIRKEIESRCSQCRAIVRRLALPSIPDDVRNWELQFGSEIPKGQFSIQVHIIDGKNQQNSYWIAGHATIFNTVAVLKTSKASGESLRAEDFDIEDRDVTFLSDLPASIKDIESSVTSRPISAQQIVTRSMLRRDWAVRMNQPVQVRSSSGGVTVSMDGISQDQALMGGAVRVKLPKTQKVISGFATDKGVVEIKL